MVVELLLAYWPQIGISIFGVSAVWLMNDKREHVRKWGPLMGIIGQPFWAWETYIKSQWFILFLCGLYSWGWCKGIYGYWYLPWRARREVEKAMSDAIFYGTGAMKDGKRVSLDEMDKQTGGK